MLHLTKAEEEKEETFRDKDTGADLEVQEKQSLLEWLANNYKKVCDDHPCATSRPLIPTAATTDCKAKHEHESARVARSSTVVIVLQFGCQLEFVTNKSQEGSQFCRGFGGIGGILRYSVDLTEFEEAEDLDGVEWDSGSDI